MKKSFFSNNISEQCGKTCSFFKILNVAKQLVVRHLQA